MPYKPDLIAIGGCHVEGYPVGAESSFVQLSGQAAGLRVAKVVNHVRLTKVAKVLADNSAVCIGSALVFQLGHFETTQKFFSKKPIGASSASESAKSASPSASKTGLSSGGRVWTPRFWVETTIKEALEFGFKLMGRPVFDEKAFQRTVEQAFDSISAAKARRVIILSTFPSAVSVVNRRRRAANRIMQAAAEARGFVYVDAFSPIFARLKDCMADLIHLNEEGHRIVYRAMVRHLPVPMVMAAE